MSSIAPKFYAGVDYDYRPESFWAVASTPFEIARRKTHSFSIDSEQGRVTVLDITTGSEFLRIITMPNGTTIAASGWVNQWDEEQVRELAINQHKGTIKDD